MSDCIIISVHHSYRSDKYITLWRPDNKGYCYRMPGVGRYERSRVMGMLSYYNSGCSNIAVDAAVVDGLAKPGDIADFDLDGVECMVVHNNAANWKCLLAAVVATPEYEPKPEYKGARYKKEST